MFALKKNRDEAAAEVNEHGLLVKPGTSAKPGTSGVYKRVEIDGNADADELSQLVAVFAKEDASGVQAEQARRFFSDADDAWDDLIPVYPTGFSRGERLCMWISAISLSAILAIYFVSRFVPVKPVDLF